MIPTLLCGMVDLSARSAYNDPHDARSLLTFSILVSTQAGRISPCTRRSNVDFSLLAQALDTVGVSIQLATGAQQEPFLELSGAQTTNECTTRPPAAREPRRSPSALPSLSR